MLLVIGLRKSRAYQGMIQCWSAILSFTTAFVLSVASAYPGGPGHGYDTGNYADLIVNMATPLLIAAIVRKSLNAQGVRVEGMMLMGAVTGFGIAHLTGNAWLGMIAKQFCRQPAHCLASDTGTGHQSGGNRSGSDHSRAGASAVIGEGFGRSSGCAPCAPIFLSERYPLIGKLTRPDFLYRIIAGYWRHWFCSAHGQVFNCARSVTISTRPCSVSPWCNGPL